MLLSEFWFLHCYCWRVLAILRFYQSGNTINVCIAVNHMLMLTNFNFWWQHFYWQFLVFFLFYFGWKWYFFLLFPYFQWKLLMTQIWLKKKKEIVISTAIMLKSFISYNHKFASKIKVNVAQNNSQIFWLWAEES